MPLVDRDVAVGTLLLRKPLHDKGSTQLHVVTNTDVATSSLDSMAVLGTEGEQFLSLGEGSLSSEDIAKLESKRLELELMISMAMTQLRQQGRLTDAWENYYRSYFTANYEKPAVKVRINQGNS